MARKIFIFSMLVLLVKLSACSSLQREPSGSWDDEPYRDPMDLHHDHNMPYGRDIRGAF